MPKTKKPFSNILGFKKKNGIVPGNADCERCQEEYSNLKSRKWTDIKFCDKKNIKNEKVELGITFLYQYLTKTMFSFYIKKGTFFRNICFFL